MMRLLVLIHRLPCPPDGGAKLRAAAQLRYLARRHQVWCAGFVDGAGGQASPLEARASLAELRKVCHGVVAVPIKRRVAMIQAAASLLTGGTATEGYFASTVLRRQVRAWCSAVEFDAVLAFSSCMAPLALEVPAKRRVLDLDDLDSVKWRESVAHATWPMTWVYRTEASRLGRREQEWLGAFDASVLISQREAALVGDPALRRRVQVIGPAIPEEIERQLASSAPDAEQSGSLPCEPVVGFVGAMDYGPNVDGACWFAESIWPRVRRQRADATWWLVGRSPTRKVRRLDDGTSIRVTGTVTDVGPYLRRMRVSIAPLRLARGVQIKVLMAMAAGRPCVVTPGVAEGIGARAGHELVVAGSAASFADAVVGLLNDTAWAEAIGQAGRQFVVTRWRSEEALARLEALLDGRRGSEASDSRSASPVVAGGGAYSARSPALEVAGAFDRMAHAGVAD